MIAKNRPFHNSKRGRGRPQGPANRGARFNLPGLTRANRALAVTSSSTEGHPAEEAAGAVRFDSGHLHVVP